MDTIPQDAVARLRLLIERHYETGRSAQDAARAVEDGAPWVVPPLLDNWAAAAAESVLSSVDMSSPLLADEGRRYVRSVMAAVSWTMNKRVHRGGRS